MPRWEGDAKARLQEAALALYDQQGFDQTTIEEIAERAGLTKRTFFRHFSDKREVLFGGGGNEPDVFANAVLTAPASAGPLDAVGLGVAALSAYIDANAELFARRFRIIRASPELWERQLIKFASMAEAAARALRARGVADSVAILAAETGLTVLRLASDQWLRHPEEKSLQKLVAEAFAELHVMTSAAKPSSAGARPLSRVRTRASAGSRTKSRVS